MNCFVIMPFARDFDDVYAVVKSSVEAAVDKQDCRCFRLDDARPAGRITDRLLTELTAASFCVADLTGTNPNVMWELGYAMALKKPVLIITQRLATAPFDVKDLQSLEYDRNHLASTLGNPLRRMVKDTLLHTSIQAKSDSQSLVGELVHQVGELKLMVAEAVKLQSHHERIRKARSNEEVVALAKLEGCWVGKVSNSHFYAAMVRDELVVPYCYCGDNALVGVFYGWRKAEEHWFARFAWLSSAIRGFAFFGAEHSGVLTGEWWYDYEAPARNDPEHSGVPEKLKRLKPRPFPSWAAKFIEDVRKHGLPSELTEG